MAMLKAAKITTIALGFAGLAVAAPALAHALAGSAGFFALLNVLFEGEASLGKLTMEKIGELMTHFSADVFRELPKEWTEGHNYDLERALATAYQEALGFLSSEAQNKGDAQLKQQMNEFLP